MLFAGTIAFGLGTGYVANVRSLVNSLVQREHYGTLNASIAVVQSIGQIIAGPVQAAAFSKGLDLGGPWPGLPFDIAGGLYILSFIAICSVKLPSHEDSTQDSTEDQNPGASRI